MAIAANTRANFAACLALFPRAGRTLIFMLEARLRVIIDWTDLSLLHPEQRESEDTTQALTLAIMETYYSWLLPACDDSIRIP
jgi:hypothetical protein